MATNPLLNLGTLNRLRCSIVVPGIPALNLISSYMGKSFAKVTFDEEPFVTAIETATGIVTSPEPYVMAVISVGILRTISIAQTWMSQVKNISLIGDVTIHSDTSAFNALIIRNAYIQRLDPGAYDGKEPVAMLTIRGVFDTNNSMWNLI